MSTRLLYVCGCRDSERLQGSLVQLLQQVLVIQVSGSSTIHARVRGVTSVSPVLHEGHCTIVPSEVLHRSGVDIIPQSPNNVFFILGAYSPQCLRRLFRRSNVSARAQERIISFDPDLLDIPGRQGAPPTSGPPEGCITALCLNVQVSLKSKLPQLEALLREQAFPPIVALTESGVPPKSVAIDSRYIRHSNPVKRNQLGTTLLFRRDSGTAVHRVDHHPGGRGLYAEARVLGHEFWILVLYCPARPYERLDETSELVQWAATHLLTRPALSTGLVGGDFNCNPWSPSHPLTSRPLIDMFTDLSVQSGTTRIRPACDAPTWYNTSGLSTCIDHWLVSTAVAARCTARVLPFDGFPSDHCSVVLALPSVFKEDPAVDRSRVLFALQGPHAADKKAEFTRAVDLEWSLTAHSDRRPGVLCSDLSEVIQKCAAEIFGVRSSGASTPFAIVRTQKLIRHLMSSGPFWWTSPITVTRIARARARIRTLWDIQLAAQRMGLKLDRHTPLTRAHYVAAYHKRFDPPVEPRYEVHIDVPPAHRPAVALDQLRSRHGAPAVSLSLNDVRRITGWLPSPMPRPVVTVSLLRELLTRTRSSSPYHDGITYGILSCLSDDMLQIVVHIINACFDTGDPYDIPAADFFALRKKAPHFFVATCRPILNMMALWKLLTLTGSHFVVRHVVNKGIIPPCQFAQYPHSS